MIFSEKLQVLRKTKGYSQEEIAEMLDVSRQAVAKWEAGLSYPDIFNLIQISNLFHVTVDYLIKEQECNVIIGREWTNDREKLIKFRLEANMHTYAASLNEAPSTRMDSHDFHYESGEYVYHDSYVGGEQFAGQEAIWKTGTVIYAMNYIGRVLNERFSGDFLKEALRAADEKNPYRGPDYYRSGNYTYKSNVTGNIEWFQGYEEIWCEEIKVYECYFHGGLMK
ncbi:MAG: DUF5680 domain-containing protein [Roseburia sp.]|nr:DUF5680 domain-containing protein [Roseburia sp.]